MFEYFPEGNIPDPGYNTIGDFLGVTINVLMGVGVSLSVVFIGLAGLRYLTAGGNPDNLDRAQKSLTYAILALVLSVSAVAIKYIIVNSILGVDGYLEDPTPRFN